MIKRLRKLREDSGMMLVVALLVITTIAVVTGVMLSHGWTNFRTTVALRGVAGTTYAADAAAKIAINNLRQGANAPGWTDPTFPGAWDNWVYTNNADGTGCFGAVGENPDNNLELNNLYPAAGDQTSASSARVECSSVPGTGIFGGGSGVGIEDPDPTDAFARALTTVGTSGAYQGITVNPLGTGGDAPLPVRGGVASKSFITVESGSLVTDGYVRAEGACSGDIVAGVDDNGVEQRFCNAAGTVPVPATPTSPLSSVPTYRDASSMGCNFQPGFYNNAAALSAAVNNCGTAYFASGQYYFDFVDEEHSGSNTWNITTTVLGGDITSPSDPSIPGRCVSPISRNSGNGVQFVFGNNSRITVSDTAHVELCGPTNGGDAPMTLYQQQSGSTASPVVVPEASAGTVDQKTGNGGGFKWTTGVPTPAGTTIRNAIASPDALSYSWLVAGNNDDVGMDLRDFPGLSAIPAGSDITSAQVRVKYRKSSARNLTVTVNGQTPSNVAISAPSPTPTPTTTEWGSADIASQLRTQLQGGSFNATRPTLELRLLDAAAADTLVIDAVTLSVTYVPPTLRAATDNIMFINAPAGNFHGEFVIQGATFAPNGFVRLVPGSFDDALVAFRWGLVARGVDFKAQPSQTFGYPLVSIPDAGVGLGNKVTVVDLKVYVCVQAGTCATGGKHALTARVMITDPPYDTSGTFEGIPEPGVRQIKVLSWAEQN
ncbi:hypothetical protein ACOACQ_02675 [Nocardioides sp. CPCC 206347]|uniref:hypothetical protein n=1 Tax=unclassified Nocardioides TaxID=2615069 RepID=UPI0036062644